MKIIFLLHVYYCFSADLLILSLKKFPPDAILQSQMQFNKIMNGIALWLFAEITAEKRRLEDFRIPDLPPGLPISSGFGTGRMKPGGNSTGNTVR